MADYSGMLFDNILYPAPLYDVSTSIYAYPPVSGYAVGAGNSGSRSLGLNFWAPEESHSGVLLDNILMNKIIVYPTEIHAGAITNDRNYNEYLWNTKRYNVSLVSNTLLNLDGIVFDTTLPDTIYHGTELKVVVTIQAEGNPTLNGYIVFTFNDSGNPVTRNVLVTGNRAYLWPYLPSYPYRERQFFKTNIFTAFSGKETRADLLESAKFKFNYNIMLYNETVAEVTQRAKAATELTIIQPCWLSRSILTQNTSTSSTDIYFDTTDRDFEADGYLVLIRDNIAETLQIDTVFSDHVSVNTAPLLDFYIGDYAVPGKHCTLQRAIPLSRTAINSAVFGIEAEEL